MELNNGQSHKSEDEDRLSMLTDDILLSILGRVDITTAVRTSVLSTQWKHLPWLLRELTFDVRNFLSVPCPNPIEVEHMDKAMSSLTKAITNFLAAPRSEATITRLQLKLYLVNNYSDVIGPFVSQAIDTGTVKDLDLAIVDEKEPDDCYDEEMLQQARTVDGFFSAYPSVFHCLTRLSLYNVCFAEWDMHHLLFDCCKQLQHLYLFNCDAGGLSEWKIHAPNSKLSVLELCFCCLGKLEVLCLPKLERFRWDSWICPNIPLSFDVVPSLKELYFICTATVDHQGFKLSEVLRDTTAVENLTLNFHGEKIWIKPEGKQLCTTFKKLRKLSLHGIFVEFDLLWTIFLLEAAPAVEIFDIEIWEHPCIVDTEKRQRTFGKRTNPSWKVPEFKSCKDWLLKEVKVTGFSPMEQQMTFLRVVMERAPNLRTVVLNDYQTCDYCEEIGALPRYERLPAERVFPKGKDERDMAVEQLIRDMPACNFQIIFGN
ncbi:uncharacterized protein LOC133893371 [Phragmites australis]|uniref:uncharacterized protein LOC133893371 n=1 Tax=Phragmites australis TaxID=29695 RepID=UPI002D777E83|nr:uncharacterized protein LOC133893371 [Phragmites australis]